MEYITIIKDEVDLKTTNRYLRLPHPRTGLPQLYLPYMSENGREGICEVVKLNGSNRRTWFIGDSVVDVGSIPVHHEIDLLFLVIPIILSLLPSTQSQAPPFQPLQDLISQASASGSFALIPPFTKSSKSEWNEGISRLLALKSAKRVLKLCCERKVIPQLPPSPPSEAGTSKQRDQVYYRPSLPCIITLLKKKVEYFAQPHIFGRFDHLIRAFGRDGLSSQAVGEEMVKSARIKASCEHLGQWLPPIVMASLLESYDFASLNVHLVNITAAQIAASTPHIQSSNSNKTAVKRKAPPASRGVESLKKVNTSSMAKMTSFFKPKEGAKK